MRVKIALSACFCVPLYLAWNHGLLNLKMPLGIHAVGTDIHNVSQLGTGMKTNLGHLGLLRKFKEKLEQIWISHFKATYYY